ncbi:MAG: site-specific DNA-methyltransferase [Patescibacteria group bacterium]
MKNSLEKKPSSLIKPGNIYKLGNHLLACGDSRAEKLVQELLSEQKFNLILTDPPYGVDYKASNHKKIANDQIQNEEVYQEFSESWLKLIKPYLKDKNSYYIFNSDRMVFSLREALISQGFKLSQLLIWVKTGAVIGRLDYCPQHELIAYGWQGKHEIPLYKDKSVLIAPKPLKNTLHPTMKPIPLLRRLILNSTKIGELVYDPFLGSGSTLLACEQTKRICIGVEIDPVYCQVIIDRFEKMTGQKASLLIP